MGYHVLSKRERTSIGSVVRNITDEKRTKHEPYHVVAVFTVEAFKERMVHLREVYAEFQMSGSEFCDAYSAWDDVTPWDVATAIAAKEDEVSRAWHDETSKRFKQTQEQHEAERVDWMRQVDAKDARIRELEAQLAFARASPEET